VRASTVLSAAIVRCSASMVAGTIQVVINMPKEAVRNVLPTIAGLKILAPSPPKTILPIAIQKTLPIIAAQTGNQRRRQRQCKNDARDNSAEVVERI